MEPTAVFLLALAAALTAGIWLLSRVLLSETAAAQAKLPDDPADDGPMDHIRRVWRDAQALRELRKVRTKGVRLTDPPTGAIPTVEPVEPAAELPVEERAGKLFEDPTASDVRPYLPQQRGRHRLRDQGRGQHWSDDVSHTGTFPAIRDGQPGDQPALSLLDEKRLIGSQR